MSGTFQQFQPVTTYYQAWVPPNPNPTLPPQDALNVGAGPSTDIYTNEWLPVVLSAWVVQDPLPQTLRNGALAKGLGAALTIQSNQILTNLESIQTAWVPPDPYPTIPSFLFHKFYTPSAANVPVPSPVGGNKVSPPHNVTTFGGTPMYNVPAVGLSGTVGAIVPAAGNNHQIAVGGTAIAAVIGPINGGYIVNPANATAQGIMTAENLYVDLVNPPGSSDALAYGTTVLLVPAQNFTLPAIATGVVVWVNAATSGHNITVVVW